MEHYSQAGKRVLIVANHTSLLDGVLLYAWLPETPTFAINTQISGRKEFRFFLRFVDLFIMDPTNPLSVKSMIKFLREDRKAVIFPEGRITRTGTLMKIYEGPGMVADKADAMVLPIAIDGAHMTPFSYMRGRGHITRFPRISIRVLAPEEINIPSSIQGHARRKAAALAMQKLMFKLLYSSFDYHQSLFSALLQASDKFGKKQVILEDFNHETLNYRQLLMRVFILGRAISQHTEKSEHVGLLMPNVNATPVLFMALQHLNRVPAMLNYTAGTQALLLACQTGKINTVYTSRRFIENAGLDDAAAELDKHLNLVYLEDLRTKITACSKLLGALRSYYPNSYHNATCGKVNSSSPAVILFTSGSEGVPKGVVLSHENLLSNFAQVQCHISFLPSDIIFNCLPLFHSFGLNAGCLMPMLGGSKSFLYPTPLHYRVIPELIYEMGATILFGTNTFFKGYARHAHPYDLHSLRYTVAGAEKLRADTQRLWMEKFGIRVLEGYGVTEASPVISVNTPISNKAESVGLPVPGVDCYIAPVEGIENSGRLIVKGPNIMLGYLLHGQQELKAPQTERGPGWYDTGDIASIDEEGFIKILGRAKRFAKIGGEMVSLTMVEELAMRSWPDFNHAAVSLPDERKGEKIILVTDNPDATRKQIQETARQLKYAELAIPRKVVLAEQLPVLGTGKTDYISLTEMAAEEDKHGSGWITKLTHFIRRTENQEQTGDGNEASSTSPVEKPGA